MLQAEHDRRFVEELQRVRRELKQQARLDSEDLAERSGDLDLEVSDGSPAEEENEENCMEKQVFRLRKENQVGALREECVCAPECSNVVSLVKGGQIPPTPGDQP